MTDTSAFEVAGSIELIQARDVELTAADSDEPLLTSPVEARSVLVNLLSVGSGELVSRVAQLAFVALVARRLGPVGFGIVGTGWAFYDLAQPVIQTGPEFVGIRTLAGNRPEVSIINHITA